MEFYFYDKMSHYIIYVIYKESSAFYLILRILHKITNRHCKIESINIFFKFVLRSKTKHMALILFISKCRGLTAAFFFCSQGTFSLIVEAYHDANNSTQSAGEQAFILSLNYFFLDRVSSHRARVHACIARARKMLE